MKLKKNFTLTGLAGEFVAVPLDGDKSFHSIIRLNKTGAEVFQAFSEGMDEEQAALKLMEKSKDLDRETAEQAVKIVTDKLKNAGLMEE